MNALDMVLAATALALLGAFIRERLANKALGRKFVALDEELHKLRATPHKQEMRIDRFELLWFPLITYSPDSKEILSASSGLPHCRDCVLPLALSPKKEWLCANCGARHPESLADLMVTDSITQQALKEFRQRHKDFRSKA